MGETAATLLAAGISIAGLGLILYYAVRNLMRSLRNVKDAVDFQVTRSRSLDAKRLRETEGVLSESPRPAAAGTAPDPAASTDGAASPASDMARYWQEEAKKSDDAHKAKIRAHVERQVPPITPAGQEAIERGRSARLAIKHVFPPRLPQRSMSYFGGLPIVPKNFDWPMVHNREGLLERLNFMAQIDCADLPPGSGRDLLPKKGYLYFFAPMSDTFGPDSMHFVTRYAPGPATQKWEPLDPPFAATIQRGPMDRVWRGKGHYDRVEIEFGWIEEPTDEEVAARSAEGHAFEVADKVRAEKTDAFFGPPVPYDPMLSAHDRPKDALWVPYEGFPITTRTARILSRLVDAYYSEEKQDVENRLEELGEVADDDPEAQRLRALKSELLTFSRKKSSALFIDGRLKDHEAAPEELKQRIMAFLDDLRLNGMPLSKDRRYDHLRLPLVINKWLEIAAIHGAEEGLTDPDGAALIPAEVVSALAHRHTPREHQMLGEGIVVQVAADEMKDRYLLLLQLGPDQALDWLVGEMGPLQYWITPEDLAAKRFENTVLTIEAY